MNKIKILCVPSDKDGCGLHRSLSPHVKLDELYSNEFDVTIEYNPNWEDVNNLKKYDIIHFHKGLYEDMDSFYKALDFCKQNNITTVMDIDDHWETNQYHVQFKNKEYVRLNRMVKDNLSKVDYVTTTTQLFADRIRKFNPNVKIFVNALDPQQMDEMKVRNESDRLRFGLVMGTNHKHDMELLRGLTNKLPKDILSKVQFVLCGFNTKGQITEISPNGEINTRDIHPFESPWFEYEKILTDGYKILSKDYINHLLRFMPNMQYPLVDSEPYKRCWTKDVANYKYMEHYNNIDVLLVPLQDNEYNVCKSELKFVEAGMMNVAVVASNVGPYSLNSVNFFEKGGNINNSGNCVLIENRKSHKDWAKTIEKFVKNPEYVTILQQNMHQYVIDKYDINKITAERAEWYKKICKK